jgi:hypothetical protein
MGCALGPEGLHHLRRARWRGERRHDQSYDRTGQSAHLPGGGTSGADRTGKVADVFPALHSAICLPPARVSLEEQTRRLEARIDDGRKTWKLSDMDLKSYSRWCDYSRARDEIFLATDTSWAPWHVVHSDNKQRARLNALTHILGKIP